MTFVPEKPIKTACGKSRCIQRRAKLTLSRFRFIARPHTSVNQRFTSPPSPSPFLSSLQRLARASTPLAEKQHRAKPRGKLLPTLQGMTLRRMQSHFRTSQMRLKKGRIMATNFYFWCVIRRISHFFPLSHHRP